MKKIFFSLIMFIYNTNCLFALQSYFLTYEGINSHSIKDFKHNREYFEKNHPKEMELYKAISDNNEKKVVELLPQVDINIKDWCGETLLMKAIWYGRINIIKILLQQPELKIDDQYDLDGDTALIKAVLAWYNNCEKEMIKLLLFAGADPTIKNKKGVSFLDYIKDYDEIEAREAYVEYYQQIITDLNNHTPSDLSNLISQYLAVPAWAKQKLEEDIKQQSKMPPGGPQID